MRLVRCFVAALAVAFAAPFATVQQITFDSLLAEMTDLERLTRWPEPAYRTVQWSSTDRRTTTTDAPNWFANADGFGGEPIPAFEKVLRAPGADGVGEYLVGDVDGPGAIVRGWSAGMDGVLRVWLDGADKPLFEGKGYDFLARRSNTLVAGFAQLDARVRRLLQQEDADYLPIPFGKHLRVTWTGRVRDLHFYHLQVRLYAGANVATPAAPPWSVAALASAAITANEGEHGGKATPFTIAPGGNSVLDERTETARMLRELAVTLQSADGAVLRGVRLRITCDGAGVPQVDAPLGDFFGVFAGVQPLATLAFAAVPGGELLARWPMPYQRQWHLELENDTAAPVQGTLRAVHAPLASPFDERTLYFHALWRADHALRAEAGKAPIDLPYLTAIGRGRFVGCGCEIVNPPMERSWRSNWWGEGDEKIFVDGALAALGTGSEDYFNYSWSHWRYFDHPYCGQPLCTGPGNCGYVTNHRLQIVDDLPFERSFAMLIELWTHRPVSPLSYGRIVWFYARPGVVTDHRALQPSELVVPSLAPWPAANANDAKERDWSADAPPWGPWVARGGDVAMAKSSWVRSGAIARWNAPAGARLELPFAVPADGGYRLRVSCQQRPDAPALQLLVDGALQHFGERDTVPFACVHGERWEDLVVDMIELTAGAHVLALSCPHGGVVGVDVAGFEAHAPAAKKLAGAVEAEAWPIVKKSDGVEVERQQMGEGWSSGEQIWIRATKTGDAVTFRLAAGKTGAQHVVLRLTTSWDYGIVRIDCNGARVGEDVDLWCGAERRLGVREVDLGVLDLTQPALLTFTVTGHAAANAAPHCYFGIDCAVLTSK